MTPKLPNVPSVPSAPSAPSVPIVPSVPSVIPTDLAGDDNTSPPLDDPNRFPTAWVFREHTDPQPRDTTGEAVFKAELDTHLQPLDEQLPPIDSYTTETDGALEPCGVVHVARTHAGDTTFNLIVVSPRYRFSR